MHRARANAGDDTPVVVVEGYTDTTALHQAGVNASVAPLGTAVTDHQVEAVWNLNPKSTPPVYCFDGDAAGKKAAYRTIDRMLSQITPTQTAKFVFLPSGEDPDSFITANGKSAFVELIDNAIPLVNVLWQREVEGRSFNNPEAKAAVKERLIQATKEIQHRDVQKLYQRMLTDRFYSEIYFDGRNDKQTSSGRGRRPSGKSTPAPISNNKKNTRRAEMILAALINHPVLISEYQDRLVNFAIGEDQLSAIRDAMVDHGSDWQDHLAKSPSERAGQIRRSNYLWFAGFAKKTAEVEEVRRGLNHTFGVTQAESIRRDITMAGKSLSDKMTEDELNRLTALQREEYLEQERDLE
jgi:DNA primase